MFDEDEETQQFLHDKIETNRKRRKVLAIVTLTALLLITLGFAFLLMNQNAGEYCKQNPNILYSEFKCFSIEECLEMCRSANRIRWLR